MEKLSKILLSVVGIFFYCFPLSAGIWEVDLEPYQEYLDLGYEIVDIKVDGLGSLGLLKKEKSIIAIMNDYRDPATYKVHNLTNFFSLYDAADFEFEPIWGDIFTGYFIIFNLKQKDGTVDDFVIVGVDDGGQLESRFRLNNSFPDFGDFEIKYLSYSTLLEFDAVLVNNSGGVRIHIPTTTNNYSTTQFLFDIPVDLHLIDFSLTGSGQVFSLKIELNSEQTQLISFDREDNSYTEKVLNTNSREILHWGAYETNEDNIEQYIIYADDDHVILALNEKDLILRYNITGKVFILLNEWGIGLIEQINDILNVEVLSFDGEQVYTQYNEHFVFDHQIEIIQELDSDIFLIGSNIFSIPNDFNKPMKLLKSNVAYLSESLFQFPGMEKDFILIRNIPLELYGSEGDTMNHLNNISEFMGIYNNSFLFRTIEGIALISDDGLHTSLYTAEKVISNGIRLIFISNGEIRILGI